MKELHPIDELFGNELRDHSYEAPMHLWDRIAATDLTPDEVVLPPAISWPFRMLSVLIGLLFAFVLTSDSVNDQLKYRALPGAFPIATTTYQTFPKTETISENLNTAGKLPPVNVAGPSSATGPETDATSNDFVLAALSKRSITPVVSAVLPEEAPGTFLAEARLNRTALRPDIPDAAGLATLPARSLTVDAPKEEEILTCIRFNEKIWTTSVDFLAGPDFAIRRLEAKDSEYSTYLRRRDDTETFRYAYSLAVRFSMTSEKGFTVRSGLSYSAIQEQLNVKTKEEELMTITTKYGPNGGVIGADTSIDIVSFYRVVNNRFTTLDIPLLAGYELPGEKLSFSFNGGAFINMSAAQRGEFISPNTFQPVSFSSNDPNSYRAFRNRIGIGLYGSIGLQFQLQDNLQLLLEPYFKYYPGSITDPDFILDQRYLTTGLQVGIRKRIL